LFILLFPYVCVFIIYYLFFSGLFFFSEFTYRFLGVLELYLVLSLDFDVYYDGLIFNY